MKKIINIVLYSVPVMAFLTFVSCKENADTDNAETTTVEMVDTSGFEQSEDMDREADTLDITPNAENPVNEYEVRP